MGVDKHFLEFYHLDPSHPFATSDNDVSIVENDIATDVKSGELVHASNGLLFGTSCMLPVLVAVPLDRGIKDYCSLDDLYTRSYIFNMSPTGVSECSNNRVHINSFPLQSTSYLQHPFTFYFCGQHEGMATNDLIENNMLRTYDPPDYLWTGNVLVVKHAAPCTTTIADVLVNVEREDFGLIKVILEWLIARNVDTRLTYPNPHRQLLTFPPVFSADPLRPPHKLFSVRDLREIVFGYCGIKSLFNLALGNFDFYAHVRQFFTSRVHCVLADAFENDAHETFMEALDHFRSFIVGSAAYRIMDPRVNFALTNINIVAVSGWRALWLLTLKDLQCVETYDNPFARDNFSIYTESFQQFLTPKGLLLTLTITKGDCMLPLLIAGDSIAESVAASLCRLMKICL
ncbi:hypothetical protein F5879DRAFT_189984 [Lentinula edodes]|nr:hypothetical protein F5879DRAFT_189984 [Lentinula edodes]